MSKNNSAIDLSSLLGTSDDSDDMSEVTGKKGTRIGGKQGAYMRITSLVETYISRAENGELSDDVAGVLSALLKDIHTVRDTSGVPQSGAKRYLGQDESGALHAFESVAIPNAASHPQFVRVYGSFRRDGIENRLQYGLAPEDQVNRVVFSNRAA